MEELFLKFKERGREIGKLTIERGELRTDNAGLKEANKNLSKEIESEKEDLRQTREKVDK
jgi:hypothetical protein